jgi:hypothetical protein
MDLNDKQRWWSEFMSEYNFIILYIKGKENMVIDALRKRSQIFSLAPPNVTLRERVLGKLLGYS